MHISMQRCRGQKKIVSANSCDHFKVGIDNTPIRPFFTAMKKLQPQCWNLHDCQIFTSKIEVKPFTSLLAQELSPMLCIFTRPLHLGWMWHKVVLTLGSNINIRMRICQGEKFPELRKFSHLKYGEGLLYLLHQR